MLFERCQCVHRFLPVEQEGHAIAHDRRRGRGTEAASDARVGDAATACSHHPNARLDASSGTDGSGTDRAASSASRPPRYGAAACTAPRPAAPASQLEADTVDRDLVLEDLTREQVLNWRTRAARDHQVVFDHIDRYGETSAQRLFTRAFVADVQRLSRLGHLTLGYSTWERS